MGATRRQFLARSGGAAGAGGAGRVDGHAGRCGDGRGSVGRVQRRTDQALVEAVAPEALFRLDATVAPGAADEFAALYARWSRSERERADALLDGLGPTFARAQRGRRARWLRDSARARSSAPGAAERERLAMTQDALTLAAVTIGPDDDGRQRLAEHHYGRRPAPRGRPRPLRDASTPAARTTTARPATAWFFTTTARAGCACGPTGRRSSRPTARLDAATPAALDPQLARAKRDGLRMVLTLYRFPTWANGTARAPPDQLAADDARPQDGDRPGDEGQEPASTARRRVADERLRPFRRPPGLPLQPQRPGAADARRRDRRARDLQRAQPAVVAAAGAERDRPTLRPQGPVIVHEGSRGCSPPRGHRAGQRARCSAARGRRTPTTNNRLSTGYASFAGASAELARWASPRGRAFAYTHHNHTDVTVRPGRRFASRRGAAL